MHQANIASYFRRSQSTSIPVCSCLGKIAKLLLSPGRLEQTDSKLLKDGKIYLESATGKSSSKHDLFGTM